MSIRMVTALLWAVRPSAQNKVSETKYHCAIGYSYSSNGDKDIDDMLKESDEMMYKDKMEYYSKPGNTKYRGSKV